MAHELSYALKLAEDLKIKAPTTEAVKYVYAQAKAQGHGGDNIVGVAQLFG